MPISRFLQGSKLNPEEIERLNSAYVQTLRSLGLVDRNDPIAELVARKILKIGAAGVRDPAEISKLAVKQLGIVRPPSL
ncbi:hypothetical protein FBZ93_111164 [Bradyrhizobium macuxiense]|uniref:Uncharacterized protein n=1 Tax=Bradyrhizobium macuxiense TaxID=1755647 RepID=A0A560LCP7_9BRAD|nr:hypothetical protein [Bradyrhizobium macuxiense]TWB93125.1 hypothetical protein FBZ93_111164 [Bradyrhizobium macuxiense]